MDDVQNENLNSPNEATEEVENTESVEEPTVDVETEDNIETLREQNKRLFERAKRAEGFVKQPDGTWVKKPKVETKTPVAPQLATPAVDPDELRLIARGLTDEEVEQAKAIAKGKDISLPEALKDPLFTAYQKERREQERREKAKLGAARGSDQAEDESLVKPGMSRDEHLELWKKTVGGK